MDDKTQKVLQIYEARFARCVKVEMQLIDIFCGKKPIPEDRKQFMDWAIMLGTPEEYQNKTE
jgi:hypothetical protein